MEEWQKGSNSKLTSEERQILHKLWLENLHKIIKEEIKPVIVEDDKPVQGFD